ncbi:MAG: glutamate ABC transporter substrate-binding protein [Promicromonosporaceae bacterium]|nr:glutamate ABC transporter substrate-binding protein [Promicromonosporaceae bacterium]
MRRHALLNHATRAVVAATCAFALLAGCGSADDLPHTAGAIRVGIKFDQPGIGLMDAEHHPTGLDVDVAAYIAWKLGYSPYEIEWVEAVSPQRERLLMAGEVDFIVATYTILDERLPLVDFAGPYFVAGQDLLVRAGDTSIASVDDLRGKSVCSASGTSSIERLVTLLGDTAEIVGRDRLSDCARMVVNGEVDAMSTDNIILAGYAASDDFFGKVRLVNAPFSQEPLGVGLPNGSMALCERINYALTEMVTDGSWQKFVDRHTGGSGYVPDAAVNPPAPIGCETTAD